MWKIYILYIFPYSLLGWEPRGGGGMAKLKADAERLFFLNLADVCWKSVLGTWECEANLENQAIFYFFIFQSWHPFQRLQNVAWEWFVYIIHWVSLVLSGFVSKLKFDSDFKPSRGRRVFCSQIPCSTVAKGAYLLCSDVGLNLAHFSTAQHPRRSAKVTRGFCGEARLQGLSRSYGPSRLYQGYTLCINLIFCLVQMPVKLRVCLVFKSQSSRASWWPQKLCIPGLAWVCAVSFSSIWVFMLLHKCDLFRIDCKNILRSQSSQ